MSHNLAGFAVRNSNRVWLVVYHMHSEIFLEIKSIVFKVPAASADDFVTSA